MLRALVTTVVAAALLPSVASATPRPASAFTRQADVAGMSVFYSGLSSYGDWVALDGCGWGWVPYGVAADWRPYTIGSWENTDAGLTWDSDEPFGWATYHYGRWGHHDRYGWVWVPGRTWGPAWVDWYSGGGYVGWGPSGFDGFDDGFWSCTARWEPLPTWGYCFVELSDFRHRHLDRYVVMSARNVGLLRHAQRFDDHGLAIRSEVERTTGKPFRVGRLVDVGSAGAVSRGGSRRGQVSVYRPSFSHDLGSVSSPPKVSLTPSSPIQPDQSGRSRAWLDQTEERMHAKLQAQQEREAARATGPSRDDLKQLHAEEERTLHDQFAHGRQVVGSWGQMERSGQVMPGRFGGGAGRLGRLGGGRPR